MHDKRALKILFNTYWSSKGWKCARQLNWIPQTLPEDLEYAISQGVMFPVRCMGHDEVQERLFELRAQISPLEVGSAFVATLSSSNIAFRSALGSYSVFLRMPLHRYSPSGRGGSCDICGLYESSEQQDLNVLSFERWKWGGTRHADPFYGAFDLERFTCEHVAPPTEEDRTALNAILDCVESMPAGAKLSDLLAAIKPIVPGNTSLRRKVISILGFAGVLRIPGYTGFFSEFTPAVDRKETPWYKDDWAYPIRWWRGGNGLNHEAISFWFGPDTRQVRRK